MASPMHEVEVAYEVRRKVYVTADTPAAARKLAKEGPDNWEDAGDIHEQMETLHLPEVRVFEGAI